MNGRSKLRAVPCINPQCIVLLQMPCTCRSQDLPLASYLKALSPLSPFIKTLDIGSYERRVEAWVHDLAVLSQSLPHITSVKLGAQGTLPSHCLLELVMGLPGLQCLELGVRIESPKDLVPAAMLAQQQAHEGRRKQPLVVIMGSGSVTGGAAAVNAELQPVLQTLRSQFGPPIVQIK